MKKWLLISIALIFGWCGVAWANPVHDIERGETMIGIAKKHKQDWKALCAQNGLMPHCQIKVGKQLKLLASEAVKASEPPACINLNRAPWNRYGSLKLRLEAIDANPDLTAEEKTEAKALVSAGRGERGMVTGDMVFKAMPFRSKDGKIKFLRDVRVCTPEQGGRPEAMETWKLSTGKTLDDMLSCGNLTFRLTPQVPPVIREDPPTQPPKKDEPPQKEAPPDEDEDVPTMVIPPKPKAQRCLLDPKLVFGQEHEPKDNGNVAHSTFVTAALYCIKRDGDGYTGWGVGLQNSWWDVRVNFGSGRAHGQSLAFGPAVERISDKGWTTEGKLLFGHMHQAFNQAQYANKREIDFVGVSVAFNDYQRRLQGKKWVPETRIYASVGVPTSVRATASNFGVPTDASELERHSVVAQAGIHLDIFDAKYATFWARVGLFSELPFSQTANLRLGVSDPLRVCGVGVGFDFDLLHGGEAPGYGWWCDGIKLVDVSREGYRLNQVSDGKTATFDNGTVMTPLEPDDEAPD